MPAPRLLPVPLVILLAAAPAAAEEDGNIWLGQFATINASEAVFVRAEAQQRFTQDAERLGQLLLRGLVGYRISDKASIGAGYAYVMTDPVGPAKLNEDRVYQELNLRLIESEGGTTLDSRTRLEWRSFRERPDSAWRLRQFVQLRVPVSENNKIVAFTEPFIDLDDGTVQRGGLSVWRNFVGVSIPLTKGVEVVPGYLNQQVFRDGEDRSDHVANVNLFMTF